MICLVSSLFNIPISSLVKALTFLHKIMESSGYIRNYFSFHIFFSYFFKYLAKCCLQVSQSDPSLVPNALLLKLINLRLVCSLDTNVFTDFLNISWLHLSTICQVFPQDHTGNFLFNGKHYPSVSYIYSGKYKWDAALCLQQ